MTPLQEKGPITNYISAVAEKIASHVNRFDETYIFKHNPELLAEDASKAYLLSVPSFKRENIKSKVISVKIHVNNMPSGTRVQYGQEYVDTEAAEYTIPYNGSAYALHYLPKNMRRLPVQMFDNGKQLVFTVTRYGIITGNSNVIAEINKEAAQIVSTLEDILKLYAEDVETVNGDLKINALFKIAHRKDEIQKRNDTNNALNPFR